MSIASGNSPPKMFEERYKPRTITGGYIENHDIVGYCHCGLHKGYLLCKHLEEHNCLGKDCCYLEKNELSHFFTQKYLMGTKKKLSKKLKKLWKSGVIPLSVYTLYDNKVRDVNGFKDLENLKETQIQITVSVGDLLNLRLDGGDDNESDDENADNSQ